MIRAAFAGGHPQGLGGDGQARLGVALGGALGAAAAGRDPGVDAAGVHGGDAVPSSSSSPAIDSEKPRRPNLPVQ